MTIFSTWSGAFSMSKRIFPGPQLLLALIIALGAMMPGIPALAQDDRVDSVTSAAIEVSHLERSGDLLTLHDLMHPDARLVVSRDDLNVWYASADAAIPTADPEILSVDFGAWTWGVTGRTYPDVASVYLRQPGMLNGTPVDQREIQHYLFDGARWRWLFGTDLAFVDALGAQTVQEPSPSAMFPDLDHARIDLVWSEIFASAGADYRSPDNVNEIEMFPATTGCGLMTEDDYAEVFYCTLDQEIYYLTDFAEQMDRQFGDYAWPHIVSHEWGHHIQFLLRIDASRDPELDGGLYDIELELQADCLAGVYAQEAVARGWLTDSDLNDAFQVMLFSGDLPGTEFDDPLAHGTGDQRRQAFASGLEDGLFGCNVTIDADS
jgi:predicted metalloprotease